MGYALTERERCSFSTDLKGMLDSLISRYYVAVSASRWESLNLLNRGSVSTLGARPQVVPTITLDLVESRVCPRHEVSISRRTSGANDAD
jgi:hypothetical protein